MKKYEKTAFILVYLCTKHCSGAIIRKGITWVVGFYYILPMTCTTFNSCPYTIFRSYNYIGACILSVYIIHIPHKISQCATKHGYCNSDKVTLVYFIFLGYLSTNVPVHFVITFWNMLMFDWFGFLFLYIHAVLICQRQGGVGISILTDSQVIKISYRLDINMLLKRIFLFLNMNPELKFWLEDIFQN